MNSHNYIQEILPTKRVLQLASVSGGKPWICTVHFYSDEQGNIYWVSTEDRRHSQELEENKNAAATVVIHEDSPEEDYVISITIEGCVKDIDDPDRVHETISRYTKKLGKDEALAWQILDSKDSLRLYCLEPNKIWIFDNKNFPDNPKQELSF